MKGILRAFVMGMALLLTAFWLTGCESRPKIGSVLIIAGGIEYAPLRNWVCSRENGVMADGMRLQPRMVEGDLPTVPLTQDFEIVIQGEDASGGLSYALYDEEFNSLCFSASQLVPPEEPGLYFVSMEASWAYKDDYERFQYLFKLKAG
ncbi:MAG: hypothetical protein LBD02_07880 [Christensenellaceae bacterium]|nr:hypothetical protein [Christensenellaceae bacterium]